MNEKEEPRRFTILLGALIALPALGTDLYNPALPGLAESFDAPVGAAQLTVTTFFAGLALGQLVWGPLSDRVGRRPALFGGLAMMLACSLYAALSPSVLHVAIARFGMGLAMSAGAVLVRSIVRDLHAHERAARLLSRITIVFSLIPIFAPPAGALIAAGGGWQLVFWCYCAVAAVLLAATTAGLAETAPAARRSANPFAILRTFAAIITDRRFLAPQLVVLSAQTGILAWVSNSAFTLISGLGVSIVAYSLMFSGVMLGQISGAWLSSRLVMRYGIARLLAAGTQIMLVSGLAAAALAWGGMGHWLALVLPYSLFLFGSALVVPGAMASALSPFPASAGAASSLIGAIAFTGGAIVSAGLGVAFDGTARPMTAVAALAGIAGFVCQLRLRRGTA